MRSAINKIKATGATLGGLILKAYVLIPFIIGWATGRLWWLLVITREALVEGFSDGSKMGAKK